MNPLNNKIVLPIDKLPTHWLNIKPVLGSAEDFPPMYLPNGQLASYEAMCSVFPEECVKHGVTMEPMIEIPKPVREAYVLNSRPTPIQRAFQLEKYLGLDPDKQKIYFKREDVSPTGSHKVNASAPQAYYAKQQGLRGLTTETGAGQWGSALALATSMFGLECKVYQVRISYNQKPGRRVLMEAYGANLIPSPSPHTKSGKALYDKDNNHPGSLGIAISEAVEDSMSSPDLRYTLGSVVDFVLLYQTVIGQEAKIQMEMAGEYPDVVIGSIGGGSNFAGCAIPFMQDKIEGEKPDLDVVGVEPDACPSITRGQYRFDYGDSAKMAPIVKMYTLGHNFIPAPVHAGGLRYHGAAPIVSKLVDDKLMRTVALSQLEIMEAGLICAKTEGILPAPECAHPVAEAIRQAKEAKANDEKKVILACYSGHGFFDVGGYKAYLDGELEHYVLTQEEIDKTLNEIEMPELEG